MLAKLQILVLVSLLFGCSQYPENMECSFQRIAGTYKVSGDQLDNISRFDRTLVVATRDGRTFMFRRDQLIACQSAAEKEHKP